MTDDEIAMRAKYKLLAETIVQIGDARHALEILGEKARSLTAELRPFGSSPCEKPSYIPLHPFSRD